MHRCQVTVFERFVSELISTPCLQIAAMLNARLEIAMIDKAPSPPPTSDNQTESNKKKGDKKRCKVKVNDTREQHDEAPKTVDIVLAKVDAQGMDLEVLEGMRLFKRVPKGAPLILRTGERIGQEYHEG